MDAAMDPEPIPHLPAEIWIMILEHLPPSFFQQDIRRLALSKRWYSLAFPTFYPRIEFTPRVISRLLHRKSQSLDRCRAQLRKSLRCVNVVLDGGRGGDGNVDLSCFNTISNLARFCLMLLECQELTAVRFTARWLNREWRADPLQARYLHLSSLERYLNLLTHVTSLDLDLCGTDVVRDVGMPVHFCPHIRPLLSRLTSLRLRLRSICHTALWPLDDQPVTLGELELSLYLGKVSVYNPKLNASRSCSSQDWVTPMDEMRASMKELVEKMVEPRRAELVHLAPSGEVHIWDALTEGCRRDRSEYNPRQCLLGWDTDPDTPCFSEDTYDLTLDGGYPYTTYGPGGFQEADDSDGEPDDPEVLDATDEYFNFDLVEPV